MLTVQFKGIEGSGKRCVNSAAVEADDHLGAAKRASKCQILASSINRTVMGSWS
jgi:hypothetical protein